MKKRARTPRLVIIFTSKLQGMYPLEMHFFVDSLLLVTQIIKGKQLYYKM
jgi:hypothetical protein